ncbi:amidase domain-containing protein [Paenibacillus chitinolyticus]|uniref:amidase domain-containing protein n=1 Tax=Paenibacillus chitinolyticus TaxID=79263 RepID=UPI003670CE90
MKLKKMVTSLVLISAFTTTSAFAQTSPAGVKDDLYQKAVQKEVENFVKKAYTPYYTINSIQLSTSDYSVKDNQLTARVNISLNKTLKAKSVDELPYVKGLKSKLNVLKLRKDASSTDAEQVVNDRMKDLQEYIGTSTDQNDSFRITAPIVNGSPDLKNANLEFLNGLVDWIPADYFIPSNESSMIENGEEFVTEAVTTNKNFLVKNVAEASLVQPLAAVTYDRIAARDYANKWTSNTTNASGYDTSKWNPKYAKHTENGGVDCANYVSQAIYAGGIPTDSTWKPESLAWVNTGRNISNGLKQYMVDTKGYFYKTTKTTTPAGGFISALKYSHVMFVVANDTVTMQFSAHTNDRLKASFANFSTSEYEFYYIKSTYLK